MRSKRLHACRSYPCYLAHRRYPGEPMHPVCVARPLRIAATYERMWRKLLPGTLTRKLVHDIPKLKLAGYQ